MSEQFTDWKVGDVTVTKIVEIVAPLPLSGLIPKATPEALKPHMDWLSPHFADDAGMSNLSIHAFVIESRGKRILVDTCVGDRTIEGLGLHGNPEFFQAMVDAGFHPDTIDFVCCTHLHFDHIGWNTRPVDGRWVPTFPNAKYFFGRPDYEEFKAGENHYAANLRDTIDPILDAGLAEFIEPNHVVTEEVRFIPTHGHSPSHMSIVIESNGETALITGDATHHPVQWAEPDWGMDADWNGEMGAQTRRKMRDDFGANGTLILGTHYAAPSAGFIVKDGDNWKFQVKAN